MTDLDHPRTRFEAAAVVGAELPLERLLVLCRPSADQARVLAADVLRALAEHDPTGPPEPWIGVGRDGRARWRPGADGRDVARAALDGLVDACAPDTPLGRGAPLLDVPRAVADPDHPPAELDVGDARDAEARRVLGALVARARADATTTGPPPAPTVAGPVPRRPWTWRRAGTTVWRRTWPWLLALVVLLAVVGGEVALLRGRIAGDLEALRTAGLPATPTAVAPTPAGPPAGPVPVLAPPAAGPVVGVDLRAVPPPCTPGAPCPVRLLVLLGAPSPGVAPPADLAWHVEVIDRCTGARTVAPGGRVSVPAGASQLYGLASPAVPPGRSLALVPVVDAPARAAGAPLLVGGTTC